MLLRALCIAVVACDGAYMGATTNVPQQLALGTPLSCRAAPAVAVMSKKTPKQTPWYEKEVYKSPEQRQRCAAPPVPAHTWSTRPSLSSTACPASPSTWGAHKRHRTCCKPDAVPHSKAMYARWRKRDIEDRQRAIIMVPLFVMAWQFGAVIDLQDPETAKIFWLAEGLLNSLVILALIENR